jgi:3',5'-cyclic AMP phosphodiesterase CpdA
MGKAIEKNDPDLVLYLGDNFYRDASRQGEAAARAAIARILRPVLAADKPFSFVFGNHDIGDSEGKLNKTDVLRWYKEIGGRNFLEPDSSFTSEKGGVTNFQYRIYNAENKLFSNLFLFDTGSVDGGQGGYDYVRKDQIAWFQTQNEADGKVPALVFQHIIVPEIYDTLYTSVPKALGKLTTTRLGKPYLLYPSFSKFTGILVEPPCPPDYTDGEFDALAKAKNVLAEINGHDHFNNFTTTREGVDIVSLSTSGWSGPNGIETYRGAHLITLNANKPGTYTRALYTYTQAKRDGAALTRVRPPQEYWIVRVVYWLELAWHGIVGFFGGVKK